MGDWLRSEVNTQGASGPGESQQAGDDMRNMEKTGHLAWCALIALLTAREDGLVESEENLFITR